MNALPLFDICENRHHGAPNVISGRISELKRDRQLVETGARRDGCAVLKLVGGGR